MAKEELIYKISLLQQKAEEIGKQIEAVMKGLQELETIRKTLENLEGKKGKEVLANVGRNIFIKTELKDEELFVDIGNKKIIKKNIKDTVVLINEQMKELSMIREHLEEQMDVIKNEANNLTSD